MKEFKNICFVGGGSWGQALAISLARAGYSSSIMVSDQDRKKILNENKSSSFPEINFPDLISAFTTKEKLKKYDLIFITTESYRVEKTLTQLIKINPKCKVIITSKGFANNEGETFPEIILKKYKELNFGILTGPTFADEVAKNLPSAAVVASINKSFAKKISSIFFNTSLRLYLSDDVIGASIAGAIKNIIAIGAGISDGLSLGDNSKAALITRGIEETSRLILASGGKKETAFGLAGIGDMTLTCSSPHSRNMKYGMQLVQKNTNLDKSLIEGLHSLKAAKALSKKLNLETPIINAINDIINNNKDIEKVISELFNRPIKSEFN